MGTNSEPGNISGVDLAPVRLPRVRLLRPEPQKKGEYVVSEKMVLMGLKMNPSQAFLAQGRATISVVLTKCVPGSEALIGKTKVSIKPVE